MPAALLVSQSALATYNQPFDFFTDVDNGWTMFADDDGVVGPGGGGQRFDTEYLFYKYNEYSNSLSIGLQTGFDVWDGHKYYNRRSYYAGDLALSFDGSVNGANGSGYEYAIDFGLFTRDIDGHKVNDGANLTGVDTAGLYKVDAWNNDIWYGTSSPFAMDEGQLLQTIDNWTGYSNMNPSNVTDVSYGKGFTDNSNDPGIDKSFFRVVTFDLSHIANLSETFTVDAHWTMSCGNDDINGSFVVARNHDNPVPEPSVLALMGIGSVSLIAGGMGRRRRKS